VGVSRGCPNFMSTPIISRTGKATNFSRFGGDIHSIHPNESPLNFLGRKGAWAYPGTAEIFFSTPYYLRNGSSYELQVLYAHSYYRSEQKPITNFGKSSSGRSQDSKFFRASIYGAHRAVVFAIAQLSCKYY